MSKYRDKKRLGAQTTHEQLAKEYASKLLLEQQISNTKFKSLNQKKLYWAIKNNDVTISSGPAGTGKTFVALWSVISLLLNHPEKYHKIVLMKPYVEAGEKLGFLPGNVKEKMDPYIISYYWCLDQIIGKELYQQLMFKKQIEVMPMGLIRGITFQNCLIILDEAQNTSPEQMKTFITRLGEDSKMIILGDEKQSDVKQNVSGLTDIREKLFGLDNVSVVVFDNKDVVRHSLIKTILDRYDDCEWLEQKTKFGT